MVARGARRALGAGHAPKDRFRGRIAEGRAAPGAALTARAGSPARGGAVPADLHERRRPLGRPGARRVEAAARARAGGPRRDRPAFGEVRTRLGGGLAGHNGLKSIKRELGRRGLHARAGRRRAPRLDRPGDRLRLRARALPRGARARSRELIERLRARRGVVLRAARRRAGSRGLDGRPTAASLRSLLGLIEEDESALRAGPRGRPRVRLRVAAPLPDRGARRARRGRALAPDAGGRRRRPRGARPRRRTCARGWRRGGCATTPRGAWPTSRISRRPRTSSACASPRWTRCSERARPGGDGAGRGAAGRRGQRRRAVGEGARPRSCARTRSRCASASCSTSTSAPASSSARATSASTRSRSAGSSRCGAACWTCSRRPRSAPCGWTCSTSRSSRCAGSRPSRSARSARSRRSRSRRRPSSRAEHRELAEIAAATGAFGAERRGARERPDIAELLPVERFGALLDLVGDGRRAGGRRRGGARAGAGRPLERRLRGVRRRGRPPPVREPREHPRDARRARAHLAVGARRAARQIELRAQSADTAARSLAEAEPELEKLVRSGYRTVVALPAPRRGRARRLQPRAPESQLAGRGATACRARARRSSRRCASRRPRCARASSRRS